MHSNDISTATLDGTTPKGKPFSREWTSRAVRLLRRVAQNPAIKQARYSWGYIGSDGHGAACANTVLLQFMDGLRGQPKQQGLALIDLNLPVKHWEIVQMNDTLRLSYNAIADKIEDAAGGPDALIYVP